MTTRYTGQQQDTRRMVKHQLGPDDQRQRLYGHIAVPSFDLTSFALQLGFRNRNPRADDPKVRLPPVSDAQPALGQDEYPQPCCPNH